MKGTFEDAVKEDNLCRMISTLWRTSLSRNWWFAELLPATARGKLLCGGDVQTPLWSSSRPWGTNSHPTNWVFECMIDDDILIDWWLWNDPETIFLVFIYAMYCVSCLCCCFPENVCSCLPPLLCVRFHKPRLSIYILFSVFRSWIFLSFWPFFLWKPMIFVRISKTSRLLWRMAVYWRDCRVRRSEIQAEQEQIGRESGQRQKERIASSCDGCWSPASQLQWGIFEQIVKTRLYRSKPCRFMKGHTEEI